MARRKQSRPEKKGSASEVNSYEEYWLQRMPPGAIKADPSKHAPHNSYGPPVWYADKRQKCVECREEFTFTAKQQQHWYEVLKIPIHVVANRCPACRRKRRDKVATQKEHMETMAKRPRHPNEAFFRKKRKA